MLELPRPKSPAYVERNSSGLFGALQMKVDGEFLHTDYKSKDQQKTYGQCAPQWSLTRSSDLEFYEFPNLDHVNRGVPPYNTCYSDPNPQGYPVAPVTSFAWRLSHREELRQFDCAVGTLGAGTTLLIPLTETTYNSAWIRFRLHGPWKCLGSLSIDIVLNGLCVRVSSRLCLERTNRPQQTILGKFFLLRGRPSPKAEF